MDFRTVIAVVCICFVSACNTGPSPAPRVTRLPDSTEVTRRKILVAVTVWWATKIPQRMARYVDDWLLSDPDIVALNSTPFRMFAKSQRIGRAAGFLEQVGVELSFSELEIENDKASVLVAWHEPGVIIGFTYILNRDREGHWFVTDTKFNFAS